MGSPALTAVQTVPPSNILTICKIVNKIFSPVHINNGGVTVPLIVSLMRESVRSEILLSFRLIWTFQLSIILLSKFGQVILASW